MKKKKATTARKVVLGPCPVCSNQMEYGDEDPEERCCAGKLKITPKHSCRDNATPYESDGALGHGWECGQCGAFLQAG